MSIYLCARIVVWLYGFSWPIEATTSRVNPMAILALFSAITMPFEVAALYSLLACIIERRKRK